MVTPTISLDEVKATMQQLDLFRVTPLPLRSEQLRWKARNTKIVGVIENPDIPPRRSSKNLRANANRWSTPEAIAQYDHIVQTLAATHQLRLYVNRRWFAKAESPKGAA